MGQFAYVDSEKLMQKSLAYLDLTKKLDRLLAGHKKELEGPGNELQQRQKKLTQERDKLSSDAFEQKIKEFQKDYESFRARTASLKDRYDHFKESGLEQIKKKMEIVSKNFLTTQKYSAVLDKSAIYMNVDLPDITDQLLDVLNKELPAVVLEKCKNTEGVCDA